MIEITCNKKQKKTIIQSLQNPDGCLFPRKRKSCVYGSDTDCVKCFEKGIKWNIK